MIVKNSQNESVKIIPIFGVTMMIMLLTGCALPRNQESKLHQETQIHPEQWIKTPQERAQVDDGKTGYIAMSDAFQSIAARIHLIREARHTLDLQYYIWADDFIGNLVLYELLKAADRGVQVQLLIDDQNGTKLDPQLKALMAHPNIHIKFYNPYKYRNFRVIDYLLRAAKINRRMHNKLIIADGTIAVTGGRNISSEYFDASSSFQFTDMDILFVGTAVQHANTVFADFWYHPLSYPAQQLLDTGTEKDLTKLRAQYKDLEKQDHSTDDKVDAEQKQLAQQLKENRMQWAEAKFLADSPAKTLDQAKDQQLIMYQIEREMGRPKKNLDLIAAYFVPTQVGTNYLTNLSKNNIDVSVLTNSFVANDVALVHAFYQKYRKDLLKNGIKLYEFKPYIERKRRTWYEIATGNVIPEKGKSKSSLHAKFISQDDQVFIGSFNLDPRSFHLNTEVGLVVKSVDLEKQISQLFNEHKYKVAYEVKLNDRGELIWYDHQSNGKIQTYSHDPQTTKFQRFMMYSVSYLPIEWLM